VELAGYGDAGRGDQRSGQRALIAYNWDHIRERARDLGWHEGGVLRLLGNVKKAAESLVTLGWGRATRPAFLQKRRPEAWGEFSRPPPSQPGLVGEHPVMTSKSYSS
jgi:hypothetical protein